MICDLHNIEHKKKPSNGAIEKSGKPPRILTRAGSFVKMSKKGSRIPSGPWGRLKPVEQDPLEAMGLPSKGDKRLLDPKAQEKYYTKIMERYMTFCTDAGKRDELLRRFASLEIQDNSASQTASTPSSSKAADVASAPNPKDMATVEPSTEALHNPANTKALSDVMMALRKLREGIVASKRVDDFSVQAYLFCVRLSILVKHPESYHPAILYLLRYLHLQCPLTSVEFHEVVGYLILDTACRRKELAEAFALRKRYKLKDPKVDMVLHALVHDNYTQFRKMRSAVDGHRARLLDYAEDDVRMRTLKAFGRTYLSVDLGFLEAMTDSKWEELKRKDGVGWELEGEKVVIRRVRAK